MNKVKLDDVVDSLISILPLFKRKLFRPDKCIENNDLSPSHLQVVFILDCVGEMSISELSKKLNIAKSNMTPLIQKLINKGFVKRIKDNKDRRVVNIVLTDTGKEFIKQHKQLIVNNLRRKISHLDSDDLEKLYNGLAYIKETISKID